MDKYGKRMQQEEDIGFPIMDEPQGMGPVSDPEKYELMLKNDRDNFAMRRAMERMNQAAQAQEALRRSPDSMGESRDLKSLMMGSPSPAPRDINYFLPQSSPSPTPNRSPAELSPPDYYENGMPVHDFELKGSSLDIEPIRGAGFTSEDARQLQPQQRFNKIRSNLK